MVYIATGRRYLQEALQSVTTLKRQMPQVAVTLFSDETPDSRLFDAHVLITDARHNYMDKVTQIRRSPYDYTIFLDTDIYVCADFSDVFAVLDTYDLAAAYDLIKHLIPTPDVPIAIPEFNTGVIAFRQSSKWQSFCDEWQQRLQTYLDEKTEGQGEIPIGDQTPFLQTVHHRSDMRAAVLPEEYNCPVRFSGCVNGTVKLLHGRHADLPRMAEQINASTGMRVHYLHYDAQRIVPYQTLEVRSTRAYLLRKRLNQYRARWRQEGTAATVKLMWAAMRRKVKV